jgi:hypothetical protein
MYCFFPDVKIYRVTSKFTCEVKQCNSLVQNIWHLCLVSNKLQLAAISHILLSAASEDGKQSTVREISFYCFAIPDTTDMFVSLCVVFYKKCEPVLWIRIRKGFKRLRSYTPVRKEMFEVNLRYINRTKNPLFRCQQKSSYLRPYFFVWLCFILFHF